LIESGACVERNFGKRKDREDLLQDNDRVVYVHEFPSSNAVGKALRYDIRNRQKEARDACLGKL
jgi:hypothetical protein